MNYDQFMGQVQSRARLASTDEAVKATRATLETLAERLAGNEALHLAAQLPREIGVFLEGKEGGQSIDLGEFHSRVAQREGVDMPDAIHHLHVVMAVLQEAVSRGEIDDVRSQLPDEYESIFQEAA
ncbi:MAG: DUF2267 domain-containing protein [Actinobacteria bacterium]|nr:MAG: DUF2267 domain-containing protein [Actinomycetota bacterium]